MMTQHIPTTGADMPGLIKRLRPAREPVYDLMMDLESLSPLERRAYDLTLEAQLKSDTNPKWRVGVTMVGYDGTLIPVFNKDLGPKNHAEQCGVCEFFRHMPANKKKLWGLWVAGARDGERVIRCDTPYTDVVEDSDDIEPSVWLCGKCAEFIHDCTANSDDVYLYLICVTGQVLKTTLRTLFPHLHTSYTVPVRYEVLDKGTPRQRLVVYPVPSTEEHKENASSNGKGH